MVLFYPRLYTHSLIKTNDAFEDVHSKAILFPFLVHLYWQRTFGMQRADEGGPLHALETGLLFYAVDSCC